MYIKSQKNYNIPQKYLNYPYTISTFIFSKKNSYRPVFLSENLRNPSKKQTIQNHRKLIRIYDSYEKSRILWHNSRRELTYGSVSRNSIEKYALCACLLSYFVLFHFLHSSVGSIFKQVHFKAPTARKKSEHINICRISRQNPRFTFATALRNSLWIMS